MEYDVSTIQTPPKLSLVTVTLSWGPSWSFRRTTIYFLIIPGKEMKLFDTYGVKSVCYYINIFI
jgi:hypothetical protein